MILKLPTFVEIFEHFFLYYEVSIIQIANKTLEIKIIPEFEPCFDSNSNQTIILKQICNPRTSIQSVIQIQY